MANDGQPKQLLFRLEGECKMWILLFPLINRSVGRLSANPNALSFDGFERRTSAHNPPLPRPLLFQLNFKEGRQKFNNLLALLTLFWENIFIF